MLELHRHHIVDLFCWVDELVSKPEKKVGRPPALSESEVLTILIWNTLALKQKTLKDVHDFVQIYHQEDFPRVPSYQSFVDECHRYLPRMFELLMQLLCATESIRIMDSTMLPVCKPHRVDSHKVAQNIAQLGKNWQGWHYGFKLHASISLDGKLCGLALTPANVYDAHPMINILNGHCRIAVGDTHYGAKVMGGIIRKAYGTIIITPPFPKQNKKIAAPWQIAFLEVRSKIECVFDYLKEHLHLISSFPRSVEGYVLHYVRILLAYQIGILACR
jgi:hypothetical protein